MSIDIKIDILSDKIAQKERYEEEKQRLIEQIMGKEIIDKIKEVEEEFAFSIDSIQGEIDSLTTEIKNDVLSLGSSCKNNFVQFVYTKPKVTYDSKALESLEKVYPLIAEAKRVGEASVSVRRIKNEK